MSIQVETKDCTALSDGELSEMADISVGGPAGYDIGLLSKAREEWVLITQAANLLGCLVLSVVAYRRWGPGRLRGMASRTEAASLLGLPRLRRHRAVIRPDLHGKAAR